MKPIRRFMSRPVIRNIISRAWTGKMKILTKDYPDMGYSPNEIDSIDRVFVEQLDQLADKSLEIGLEIGTVLFYKDKKYRLSDKIVIGDEEEVKLDKVFMTVEKHEISEMIGDAHTHPGGLPIPSPPDIVETAYSGLLLGRDEFLCITINKFPDMDLLVALCIECIETLKKNMSKTFHDMKESIDRLYSFLRSKLGPTYTREEFFYEIVHEIVPDIDDLDHFIELGSQVIYFKERAIKELDTLYDKYWDPTDMYWFGLSDLLVDKFVINRYGDLIKIIRMKDLQ